MKNKLPHSIFFALYRVILFPLLMLSFKALARFNSKIGEGLKLRQTNADAPPPWLMWKAEQSPIWIHCASMELEYAKPVITQLKAQAPECKILVTYFSPSVATAAKRFPGIDFACPMPWDRPSDWRAFLDHHKPRALLIARTDTWPEMLRQTHEYNIPSLLFSATLAEKSGRARGLGRWMSKIVFSYLTQIFCVTETDREVFTSLGLGERTRVAGDTRYDQVQARLLAPKPLREELFVHSAIEPVFIAGSTWSEDEDVLIPVIENLKDQIRFVLVPHEPTESHLRELEGQLQEKGLRSIRYSKANAWQKDEVLLIDQIGILAELYAKARFAFVGGSYRKTVHSVMEPLAAGCLTFVGPHFRNNREAIEFSEISLKAVSNLKLVQPAQDAVEFKALLAQALQDFAIDSDRERIREEIRQRSYKSELVVNWVYHNTQN